MCFYWMETFCWVMVTNSWISPLGNQTASFVSTLWHSCVKWNYSLGCIVCTVIYSIAWMRKTSPVYMQSICKINQQKILLSETGSVHIFSWNWFGDLGLGWISSAYSFCISCTRASAQFFTFGNRKLTKAQKSGANLWKYKFSMILKIFKNTISFSSTGNFMLNGSLAQF